MKHPMLGERTDYGWHALIDECIDILEPSEDLEIVRTRLYLLFEALLWDVDKYARIHERKKLGMPEKYDEDYDVSGYDLAAK